MAPLELIQSPGQTFAQAGPPAASCPEPCPAEFWVSPRIWPPLLCRCSSSFIISMSIYCVYSLLWVRVCLVLRSLWLHPPLQVWPHQFRVVWKDYLPKPAATALTDQAQDLLPPLLRGQRCCLVVNLMSTRTLRAFLQSCFPCVWPQPVLKVASACHPEAATAGLVAEPRREQNNLHCNRGEKKQLNNIILIILKPQWILKNSMNISIKSISSLV